VKPYVKWPLLAAGGLLGSALALFLGSYLAFSGQFAVPATTVDDPALPGRTVGGYRYHLEVFGLPTHPTVIVLHAGPGGDYRSLLPLKRLSDDFQVVFYDQRGSGLSPRVPAAELSLERFVEDLHEIGLSLSEHQPVRLVGHSWGAMLAAAYVDRHPERVSHAALAEPPFLTADDGNRWLDAVGLGAPSLSAPLAFQVWRSWIQSLYVYGPDEAAREDFLAVTLMQLDVPNHPLADYYCDRDPRGAYLPAWRFGARVAPALIEEATGSDGRLRANIVTPQVKRFPHKVLFLAGSCNTVNGPEAQQRNLGLFANAELQVIADAGHTMIGEKPDASLRALRSYLSEDHSAIVASD
jgi:proline iminopeptidase